MLLLSCVFHCLLLPSHSIRTNKQSKNTSPLAATIAQYTMAINTTMTMNDSSSSVYYPQQYRTHYPDILSAPAPVLRDEDILVDGETVAHLSPNTMSFSDYSVVTTTTGFVETAASATAPNSVYDSNNDYSRPPTTIVTSSTSPTSTSYSSSYKSDTNNHNDEAAMVPSSSPSPSTHVLYYYDPYAPATTTTTTMTRYEEPSHGRVLVNLPPEVQAMKERRKVGTVAVGVVGGFVGLVTLGPIGAVAIGATAAVATKQVGKRLEKRKLKKVEAAKFAMEEQLYGKQPLPAFNAVLS
jgi:hypothetical protein